MRTLWLTLALILFLAAPSFAWSEQYTWTADPDRLPIRSRRVSTRRDVDGRRNPCDSELHLHRSR